MLYSRNNGVTLVELMTVIAIVGVLLMIAVPAMRYMVPNRLADRIYQDLEIDLRYARSQASTTARTIEFEPLNSWEGGWKITDKTTDNILRKRTYDLTSNTITSSEIKTGVPLIFASNGRTNIDANVTISVPECTGKRVRTLSINRIGQIQTAGVATCP